MIQTPIFVVDAFVGQLQNRVLRGNPAAVALLDAPRDAEWMQEVAAEMNLSETAFLVPKGANDFDLRWFTPTCEVDLCGHATLASAHILWETGQIPPEQSLHFHTLSGVLTARKRHDRIALDFPAHDSVSCETPQLLAALGAALGIEAHQSLGVHRASDDILVELDHENLIEFLAPDFEQLRQICEAGEARGVIVTARSARRIAESGYDFVSRFFGPAVGIDEDPVTGSAHTKLAPFWSARLGKVRLIGLQASKRGGLIEMEWHGARVELLGVAATRLRGEWVG